MIGGVEAETMSVPVQMNTSMLSDEQTSKFLFLVARANKNDETAMLELTQLFNAVPALAQQLGDLAAITRGMWIGRIAGGQLALAEALRRSSEALRAELTQPGDGPLERLLIERIATCQLHIEFVEGDYARKAGQLDPEWTTAFQKRIDRARRRFLQAVRALAQVRRLAVPATFGTQLQQTGPSIRTVA
jgi:hypothetical protein